MLDLDAIILEKGAHASREDGVCAMERSRRSDGTFASEEAQVRFWRLVERLGVGCWLWLGRFDEHGYGRISVNGRCNVGAHRVSWGLTRGEIPEGLFVCHRCDNPPCVNPSHLFLGSCADNNRDRHAKGRSENLTRGASHPKAKLSAIEVEDMRGLRAEGWTQQRLADRFGISRGNVSKVVNGRSY